MAGIGKARVVIWLCFAGLLVFCTSADVVRSKRDDADTIVVSTIEELPYVSKNGDDFEGFIPEMMEKIYEIMRATYEFRLVPDGRYGQKGSNGNWNGMIGQIQNHKADMAAAPMTVSDERKEIVDFTEPFMTFDIAVLIKKPEDGDDPPVKSVTDLADQTAIKYGLVRDGRTARIFEDSKDDKYKKMWNQIQSGNRLASNEAGVKKVRESNGTFAFIMESVSAEYWVLEKPCDLMLTPEAEEQDKKSSYAFALKKNWNKKKDFDDAIKQLKDNGELAKLKKKWWKGDCGPSSSADLVESVSVLKLTFLVVASAVLSYRH